MTRSVWFLSCLAVVSPVLLAGGESVSNQEMFGRLHPLVLHFPIALLTVALPAELLYALTGKPGLRGAARWCLWTGTLGALAAAWTGWVTAGYSSYSTESLDTHRWLGVLSAVSALAVLVVYEVAWLKDCPVGRWIARAGLALLVALVGWTGHEGGKLVYGENYFSREKEVFDSQQAGAEFVSDIRPILEEYCFLCHQGARSAGGVDLAVVSGAEYLAQRPKLLGEVYGVLVENRMPPRNQPQPAPGQMRALIDWSAQAAEILADRQGTPLPPRSRPDAHFETITRLTGVRIDPSDATPIVLEPEEQALPAGLGESAYDSVFLTEIRPILGKYCVTCHSGPGAKAEVDIAAMQRVADIQKAPKTLEKMILVMQNDLMPPERMPQPSDEERARLIEFLADVKEEIARLQADMPGPVTMPRLNPDQYNNVIRDLTGVDIQPARQFPREGGGGEGFSNVGEAMSITPQLTQKLLRASRDILRHARITPAKGLQWSSSPVPEFTSPEELRYYAVRRRVGWMNVQNDYYSSRLLDRLEKEMGLRHGAYFEAAWRYRHRDQIVGLRGADFSKVADDFEIRLHPVSIEKWYNLLTDESQTGIIGNFAKKWRALPKPGEVSTRELRKVFAEFDSVFQRLRPGSREPYSIDRSHRPDRRPRTDEEKAFQERLAKGCYGYIIDTSEHKKLFLIASSAYDGNRGDYVVWKNGRVKMADGSEKPVSQVATLRTPSGKAVAWGTHPVEGAKIDPGAVAVLAPAALEILLPDEAKEMRIDACVDLDLPESGEASVQTLIDRELPEDDLELLRQRWFYGPEGSEKVKGLFQAVEDLDEMLTGRIKGGAQAKPDFWFYGWDEIDPKYIGGPWNEKLQFRAGKANEGEPGEMYYFTFDQIIRHATPEARNELEQIEQDILLLAQAPQQDLLAFLRKQGLEEIDEGILPPPHVVEGWDEPARKQYARLVRAVEDNEKRLAKHARALIEDFATRAWRRKVGAGQLEDLLALYKAQRTKGKNYEESIRLPLRVVLTSPRFVYLIQRSQDSPEPYALTDYELATRLSFFLWASVPDEELLTLAQEGRLQDPEVLRAQLRRMLEDSRSRALGSQFAAQWLHFADFDQYNTPDRELFPEFTDTLRKAMYEESVMFFQDLFARNRPVDSLWSADYSFLNEELAGHYGIERVEGDRMRRVKVPADRRGGVIAMGSILTRTSTALRTSPVLRGNWVTGALMGTPVGEPPPNVPPISEEETNPEGLSVAEQLKLHRKLPGCASCHEIMDPPGMSLENFDPIGRWRDTYRAGTEVQAVGVTKRGRRIEGFAGFRDFCRENRDKIIRQLCRKLVGYALGRAVQPGDEPLIERMIASLEENENGATVLLDEIVISRQFRYRQDLYRDVEETSHQE